MPRTRRIAAGGYAYHVMNRAVRRMTIFTSDADYAAFERVLAEAIARRPAARLLGYCIMPNHWHLVLWPQGDDDLSEFMRWLTLTHTQRWNMHRQMVGTGPVYQGRFKSFPIEQDHHLHAVLRYVERNPLRAGLVDAAENWRWSSLWRWENRRLAEANAKEKPALSEWPDGGRPRGWTELVNRPMTENEVDAIQQCLQRNAPYGDDRWRTRTVAQLGLESTLRPRGRPRRPEKGV